MSLKNRKKYVSSIKKKDDYSKLDELSNGTSLPSTGSDVDNDSVTSSTSESLHSCNLIANTSITTQNTKSPFTDIYHNKRLMIRDALDNNPVDVDKLRQLSISKGGLLDNDLRIKAWPSLLDIDIDNIPEKPSEQDLKSHRDYSQVVLDVNRSVKRFPPGMEEEVRLSYQDQLIDCIMWILLSNIELHYYQGFHDVVVTFLLVVGERLTFAVVDKLCKNHFRDFMEVTMEKTYGMLHFLLPIIDKANPELKIFLEKSEVGPTFCLSWLITWYGHVLNNLKDIVRLYDFFIACHPLMPIYLAADIVLYRGEDVMVCECEMPYVHQLLSRIPEDLPFEKLITRSGDLFLQYPPSVLEHEAKLQRLKELRVIEERRELDRLRMVRRQGGVGGRRRGVRRERQYMVLVAIMGTVTAVAYNYWRGGGGKLEWPVNLMWM